MSPANAGYRENLQRSFGSMYSALEVPAVARRGVVFLLIIHTVLLAYSAYVHSPTLNEPAHLVAGLSHWKFGRFELYRVNPPLVRMVAALPVFAAGFKEDWGGFYEEPGARPEMAMGADFAAANGERTLFLFMIARWACIPFSWVGAVTCYLWARDLYGRPSGVLACSFWCFEPNILAHASLITPDAHATALGLAACYTFWRWLRRPTWSQTVGTGIVLGLAELAKTTFILFYPIWPIMWVLYRWPCRNAMTRAVWLREAGMLVARMLIGLAILNLGYGFEGSFSSLRNTIFVSSLFTGNPISKVAGNQPAGLSAAPSRFEGTVFEDFRAPFPRNYLIGIDIQQRDFENYGRPSYLRGEWRDEGWWYYYLYAVAIKVPLGLWAIGCIAAGLVLHAGWVEKHRLLPVSQCAASACDQPAENMTLYLSVRDEAILLAPAVIIFLVASCKTGINEHLRYVLPAFPFFFIFFSQSFQVVGKRLVGEPLTRVAALAYTTPPTGQQSVQCSQGGSMTLAWPVLVAFFFSWFVASSLWVFPHNLSYFNELVGGPGRGAQHLLGSNVDWGQDLRYLQSSKLMAGDVSRFLVYFGPFDPTVIGLGRFQPVEEPLHLSLRGDSSQIALGSGAPGQEEGYFVISTNFMEGLCWNSYNGQPHGIYIEPSDLSGIREGEVIERLGYSMQTIHVRDEDLR